MCDPMDCSLPGSSIYGILQAKILEQVAMPSSRGSSQLRDQTQVSHIAGGFFTVCAIREAKNTEVNSLSLLMESSQPRNRTGVSCIAGETTICSSNSALVIYLKKMKSLTQRDIYTLHVHCTNIYSSHDVETNLCLSTYEWIKEMCTKVHTHTHTMKYYSAIRNEKFLP